MLTPEDSSNFGYYAKDLAHALYSRGEPSDLNESIDLYQKILHIFPESDGKYHDVHASYCLALYNRGSEEDRDKSLETFRKLIPVLPPKSGYLAKCHNLLGKALGAKDLTMYLDEVISHLRAAMELGVDSKPSTLAEYAIDLGDALSEKSHEGRDEAIEKYRKAVALSADDTLDEAWYANKLAKALYDREGFNDRQEAVECLRAAVRLSGEDYIYSHIYLGSLGHVLVELRLRGKRNEAINVLRQSIGLAPEGHDELPERWENLASPFANYEPQPPTTETSCLSLHSIPEDARGRVAWFAVKLFSPTSPNEDIEQAIVCIRKSIELECTPVRQATLANLLVFRYTQCGNVRDIEEAGQTWEEITNEVMEEKDAAILAIGMGHSGMIYLRCPSRRRENVLRWLERMSGNAENLQETSNWTLLSGISLLARAVLDQDG